MHDRTTARDRVNGFRRRRAGWSEAGNEEGIGRELCVSSAGDGAGRRCGRPVAGAALQGAAGAGGAALDWSDFLLGINSGGGWRRSNWGVNNTGFGVNGGQAGGMFGYNRQFGNFVFGVEGDIDWSGLNGTGTSAGCPGGCSTSETWLSTVRGRIGYSFDRVMPYATGGLAVGDIRTSMPGFAGGTSTNAGWTLGGGVEFALPGNWSAKAEYLPCRPRQLQLHRVHARAGRQRLASGKRVSGRRELPLRLGEIADRLRSNFPCY